MATPSPYSKMVTSRQGRGYLVKLYFHKLRAPTFRRIGYLKDDPDYLREFVLLALGDGMDWGLRLHQSHMFIPTYLFFMLMETQKEESLVRLCPHHSVLPEF